jgi:hypothetical protein
VFISVTFFLKRKSSKSVTHVTEARIERVEEIFLFEKKTKRPTPLITHRFGFI